MRMEDIGLVLEVLKFNREGDYIQIPDRPYDCVFRGGFMTAAILAETKDQKVNFITSQGEVIYTEKRKEIKA